MKKRVHRKMKPVFFVALALAVVALASLTVLGLMRLKKSQPACKDCNLILISLDTLSANHLPCYGYGRDTAPSLCGFGRENIMFENMYSNASWTLPSHASIFTGLLPSQHRVLDSYKDYLSPTIPFLPQVLQQKGYKTYFYMKLGSNSLPENYVYYRGINELHNVSHPNDWDPGLNRLLENDKNRQKTFLFLHTYWVHMPYLLQDQNNKLFTAGETPPPNIPVTKEQIYACTDSFLGDFQKTLAYDLGPNSDNFWNAPQKPLYQEIYGKLLEYKRNPEKLHALCEEPKYRDAIRLYMEGSYEERIDKFDKNQIRYIVDAYDSKIMELDAYVQKVINFVRKSGLKNDTVIVITADHGEEFMEHGHIAHAKNLYDTTLKVPLIMYVPGTKNMTVAAPAQSVDLMPTLLGVLGIPNSFAFAGVNLFDPANINDVGHITQAEQISFGQRNYTIRRENWKLHYRKNSKGITPLELYDMSVDPQEKNNVMFANQSVVEDLLKKITR